MLFAGPGQRLVELLVGLHPDGDADTLLTAGGFDDDLADLVQERVVGIVEGGQPAPRHLDTRFGDDPAGEPLVVAAGHRHRGGELRQRLPGHHRPAAVGQTHLTGLGVEHLDPDSAPHRLIGDDPGVRVEVVDGLRRMGEQRFVDRVLAFHRQHRNPLEAQLLVQVDGGGVVVCHRQIHVGAAPVAEDRRQCTGQRRTDTGQPRRRVHRQRPQARTVLRVGEQPLVVDPGDRADHRTVVVAHRDEVLHRLGVQVVVPDDVDRRRHHPTPHVDAVHLIGLFAGPRRTDRDTGRRRFGDLVVFVEPQPVGVARIDEQFGGGQRDQHVGLAGVDADVAPSRTFLAHHLGQVIGIGEGLAEDQTAPTQFKHHILGHDVHQMLWGRVVQAQGDGFGVIGGIGGFRFGHDATPVMPCFCSHISNSAICHNSLPRNGVSRPLGSASRRSTASGRNSPRSLASGA